MKIKDITNNISLRKINSLVVLIIFLLLAEHALLSTLYLLGITGYSPTFQKTGRRLFLWIALHAIISLYLYIKDKRKQKKQRKYDHIRKDTKIQMISGMGIIIFGLMHVITYSIAPANTYQLNMIHFFTDNMLFISLITHLQISIPKLMISYGYLTEEGSYKATTRKIRITLTIILIIMITAETIHYII